MRNEIERAKLRAELDGIIAHLYGLTEEEFKHILSTFKKNIRKGEAMDRNGVFGWDSPELHLGGEDGGSITEARLYD